MTNPNDLPVSGRALIDLGQQVADLRDRLAAAEGERDKAEQAESVLRGLNEAAEQALAEERRPCHYGHRLFVNEGVPPYDEVCAVCHAQHRATQAEQALAAVTAERDAWRASSAGYGSDMVEWKVRAQAAEQQRDTALAQVTALTADLAAANDVINRSRTLYDNRVIVELGAANERMHAELKYIANALAGDAEADAALAVDRLKAQCAELESALAAVTAERDAAEKLNAGLIERLADCRAESGLLRMEKRAEAAEQQRDTAQAALRQARKAVDDAARIRVAGASEMGQYARLMDAMGILDAALAAAPREDA